MFSKRQVAIFVIGALAAHSGDALAPQTAPSSRRSFIGRIATTGAVVAAGVTDPGKALAVGKRGGKDMIDAGHNGVPLSGKESNVANGLLGKMGLDDITPDKGSKYSNTQGGRAPAQDKGKTPTR